jgi:uncharacterized protein YndB with AHSA1/START domain
VKDRLSTTHGRPTLRLERRFAHPPAKVWRAVTEPEHLSQWYPFRIAHMDFRVGGSIRFDDGEGTTYTGVITELDPPRVFAFSETPPESMPREGPDLVHLELRQDGDGCILVFTHVFDDRPAAASYATGWHGCLAALAFVVEDAPVDFPPMSVDRYEGYVRAFGLAEGSAEVGQDGWLLRYERQLFRQPVDRVWAALAGGVPEPTVGSPPPATFTTAESPAGTVRTVEAPTVLEYAVGAAPGAGDVDGDADGGTVRWELSEGPGGARILLTQSGPPESASMRTSALAGWKSHIEHLVAGLAEGTD